MKTMKCKHPTCDQRVRARGFCIAHYNSYSRVESTFIKARQAGVGNLLDWEAVYVVGAKELPHVKVGRAKDMRGRIENMQVGNPFKIHIFNAYFMTKSVALCVEWESHRILDSIGAAHRGEWYIIHPDEAAIVIERAAKIHGFELLSMDDYVQQVMSAIHPTFGSRGPGCAHEGRLQWASDAKAVGRVALGC